MTFLEQLQQSAGLLNNQIKNTNLFGNYNPNLASDYVTTSFGQPIAQNRFLGNEFQVPNLSQQTYTPGAFAPGAGFNFGNMGTYTPGAFNQYGNIPMTGNIPSNVSTTTMQERGGGGRDRMGPGVSTEVIGGRAFRFNPDGTVTQLDPNSLDAKLATTVNSLLGYTPMNVAKGLLGIGDDPNDIYERIENTYGTQTALDFSRLNAEAINKAMTANADERRAEIAKEFAKTASQEQLDRIAMTDAQRGITSAKSDPSKSRQGTEAGRAESRAGTNKARDDASRSTGIGRGFMGGR
tara:strand:- start:301 stop:1182 length:882 start_codon:yes stop_codon:yes gene_type:complete